jgi:hypothetical protein
MRKTERIIGKRFEEKAQHVKIEPPCSPEKQRFLRPGTGLGE